MMRRPRRYFLMASVLGVSVLLASCGSATGSHSTPKGTEVPAVRKSSDQGVGEPSALGVANPSSTLARQQNWVLTWSDDFSSPRDLEKWVLSSGGGGWGHEELQ